jgi:hypothetical protein
MGNATEKHWAILLGHFMTSFVDLCGNSFRYGRFFPVLSQTGPV